MILVVSKTYMVGPNLDKKTITPFLFCFIVFFFTNFDLKKIPHPHSILDRHLHHTHHPYINQLYRPSFTLPCIANITNLLSPSHHRDHHHIKSSSSAALLKGTPLQTHHPSVPSPTNIIIFTTVCDFFGDRQLWGNK